MSTTRAETTTQAQMEQRLVRYADLKPCTNAFIDARTPGSDRKENFTIIGPGVAENPDQHVHIRIPHGFNIGGARQPPGCTNSQHSHETAEVFVIQHGAFRFKTGEHGTSGHVDLGPGDVISIPTRTFRGFDTLGERESFMFSVLGGDDPGRVLWAPYVFEAARRHGLVLLANGSLVDTQRGETIPPGERPMAPTGPQDIARLAQYDSAGIATCTVPRGRLTAAPGSPLARFAGVHECPIVGAANAAEAMPAGPLAWAHGFHLRALHLEAGARIARHVRLEAEVLLMHRGALQVDWRGGSLRLGPGDTLTLPIGLPREFSNPSEETTEVYVVRGGDSPAAPVFASEARIPSR